MSHAINEAKVAASIAHLELLLNDANTIDAGLPLLEAEEDIQCLLTEIKRLQAPPAVAGEG